jgi:CRISPR-associated exonuclease Cas4
MKIQTVTLHNWRSIKDETINFQDMMIFIGQNNHGKSNVLYALLFFFGQVTLDILDFNGESNELFVEITFSELDADDKTTFKKYLSNKNTIKVRKNAIKGEGFEYHGYLETPSEEWLREDKISDFTKRDVAESLPLKDHLPESGKITKDQFREAQEKYIVEHRDELTFSYKIEDGPFLGAKNVAKGIFGDVYFVPSVKKAADDLSVKGNTVFNELYSRVINKMSETNEGFREAKEKIISLIGILNKTTKDGTQNTQRPAELTLFEDSLQKELAAWDTTIDVEIFAPDINEVFRVGTTVWVNDGIKTDISRKGQGLQRAMIFALVRALANIMKAERIAIKAQKENEEPDLITLSRKASKSTYFILEEPELYLHPQAQREIYDSLVELSKGNNQVIMCTHSSSFINLDQYKSICCIRKESLERGTTAFQCCDELFTDDEDKRKFNLTYWINPDRSEMFFARKVILVEGPTDKTVIPHLATTIGIFRHDYTLIDCGSKSAIPSYLLLLHKYSIPYVVVYDLDHQAYKLPDAIASADADSTRITGMIKPVLGKTVVLINDIEEEIGIKEKSDKSKPYKALTYIKEPGFSLPADLESKVKAIYQ